MAEGAGLARGQHVLEIGTGWGGFALYAAGELGCRVTSITISREQHDLARERVRAAGLEHLVDIQLRDYRDITGHLRRDRLDRDARGRRRRVLRTFFEVCDAALVPGGRLSLQSITFPDAAYERQLRGANWIQTYIFPGGLCPSLAVIERATRDTRPADRAGDRHRRRLRPDPAGVADAVHGPARRRPGDGLRRPVHPDVGVLPRPERGRLRDGHQPGPADRAREAARARGRSVRPDRSRPREATIRGVSPSSVPPSDPAPRRRAAARPRHPDHRLDRDRRGDRASAARPRAPRSSSCRAPPTTRGRWRSALEAGGAAAGWAAADLDRRGRGRCRRRGGGRPLRADRRAVLGRRRQRPAVRRRPDPRADRRRRWDRDRWTSTCAARHGLPRGRPGRCATSRPTTPGPAARSC